MDELGDQNEEWTWESHPYEIIFGLSHEVGVLGLYNVGLGFHVFGAVFNSCFGDSLY